MREEGFFCGTVSTPDQRFPAGGVIDHARSAYRITPLKMTRICAKVIAFVGAGGTVTAIGGSRGSAIIDTGYKTRVDEIRRGIASTLQQSPRWLINTHWHFDHTDGNSKFVEDGATIIAHTNCRARMSQDQYVPSLQWTVRASPRAAWPTETFDVPVVIDLGWETLQLIPQSPAHTDGDVAVLLPTANVLITGGLLTNGSYPIIDESSGGSLHGMIEAIERLLPFVNADTVVVPGHGAIANREILLGFRDMLIAIEHRIQSLIASGIPYPEIIASSPTAEFDAIWGRGYVTGDIFVRMVLAGLGVAANTKVKAQRTA
jgi:cyclase